MTLYSHDVAIAAIFLITGWMLKTWLSHQERMKAMALSQRGLTASDQRLERVEQAVEAIAVEIERVSEGQRFVTKLLGEHSPGLPAVALSRPARADTPH